MEQRTIQTQESAERIDALLARSLPGLTRSAAQRLLAQGAVTKDGAPVKKNYKTVPGDTFVVTLPDAAPSELVAQDLPLDVVYEDADLIVVNKPRGMVVHPAPGHEDGTLVNALLAHCGESLSGVGGERRPGIVHRIDKDTSGLLVWPTIRWPARMKPSPAAICARMPARSMRPSAATRPIASAWP